MKMMKERRVLGTSSSTESMMSTSTPAWYCTSPASREATYLGDMVKWCNGEIIILKWCITPLYGVIVKWCLMCCNEGHT